MNLRIRPYPLEENQRPHKGRHVLAQYDDGSVVVYQAFRPSIAHYALEHGAFGGEFSFHRMSWIKPSFLWMMYRSAWGTKRDQEVTLAVRMSRPAFDQLLNVAVWSSHVPEIHGERGVWETESAASVVRLQWDPDRDPAGGPLRRRAIQLGLRGDALHRYAHEWILDIQDISEFVREQRHRMDAHAYDRLLTPIETVYPVTDPLTQRRLGVH